MIVRKRFGTLAATASALTLAVFPAFVAVSRDNNVDALLILLMTLACGAALRAIETGRLRTLLGSAVLVALAFNTKALAAYLVVPGIAAGYLCCAPGPLRRRAGHLLLAGVVCGALSLAWMLAVDLTPASQRPFVGSSTDNSGAGADVQLQRLRTRRRASRRSRGGRQPRSAARSPRSLGAARTHTATGACCPSPHRTWPRRSRRRSKRVRSRSAAAPGPLRLFRWGFGDQGAWMLAFALVGLVAIAITRPARRDPQTRGVDRFRRVLPVRGGVPEHVQGHRAPLLRLGAGPRGGGHGRRRARRDGAAGAQRQRR